MRRAHSRSLNVVPTRNVLAFRYSSTVLVQRFWGLKCNLGSRWARRGKSRPTIDCNLLTRITIMTIRTCPAQFAYVRVLPTSHHGYVFSSPAGRHYTVSVSHRQQASDILYGTGNKFGGVRSNHTNGRRDDCFQYPGSSTPRTYTIMLSRRLSFLGTMIKTGRRHQ